MSEVTTDKIRDLLSTARTVEGVSRASGARSTAPPAIATNLRMEALTLAICELLDAGLVLADPAELFDQERLCGETVPGSRFMCELAVGHDGEHQAPEYEPRRCRVCGCTEARACKRVLPPTHAGGGPIETCHWIEDDLCFACGPDAGDGWEHPAASGG